MSWFETVFASVSSLVAATAVMAFGSVFPPNPLTVSNSTVVTATTTEVVLFKPTLIDQRTVRENTIATVTTSDGTAKNLEAFSLYTEQRFAGLLSHTHWLLSTYRTQDIERLEKQIFRLMDDTTDSLSDIRDEDNNSGGGGGGVSPGDTLTTVTLATPVFSGPIASNLALGTNFISGDGDNEGLYVSITGNIGIGTTTPSARLTVAGDAYITGAFRDSTNSAGTSGMVLQSTGTGFTWVATSTLGLGGSGGGLFIADIDTSAKVAAIVSDETGSGALVFGTNPILTTPNLGTPTTITLTNATGLPLATGVTGTLGVSNGGTGSTNFVVGSLLVGNGTSAVTSTTTAGLKTTLGLNNVENTALSTWIGSTNLTTLGTIIAGTWQGTVIDDAYLTKTGDWIGTFDGQQGTYYLNRANHTGTQTASTISDFSATARGLFSSTATGLTYTSGTGVFSLTAGYSIPLTASTTEWTNFYSTPSSRITAGTGLSWSTNTLNIADNYILNTGDTITGNFVLGGTNANVVLGSNFLSGDGGDEGIFVNGSGNVSVGTTSNAFGARVFLTRTDTNGSEITLQSQNRPRYTASGGAVFPRAGLFDVQAFVAAGRVVTGEVIGATISVTRGTEAGDTGTMEALSGLTVGYGHFSTSAPVTTDVLGLRITPAHVGGTIGTSTGILIENALTGGTVGNYFGIYQNDPLARNFFAGNFGIGTTTPSARLTVAGDAYITGTLRDSTNASGTSGMILQSTGTGFTWVATSTLGLGGSGATSSLGDFIEPAEMAVADFGSFSCDGFECRIDNGAVDISSQTNLSVDALGLALSGDEITLSAGYDIPLIASTTEWNTFYNTPSTRITSGSNLSWSGNTLNVTGLGNGTLAGLTDTTITSPATGQLLSYNGSTWVNVATSTLGLGGGGSTVTFGTDNQIPFTNTVGTDYEYSTDFTFDGSQLSVGGNGISLAGTSANIALGTNFLSGDGGDEGLTISSTGAATFSSQVLANGTASSPAFAAQTQPNQGIFFPTLSSMAFSISGFERVRLNSSGNFGIGTTNPGSRLTVVGTAEISGTTTFAGNVGIGTTTPAAQITIDSGDGMIALGTGVFSGKAGPTDTGIQFGGGARPRSGIVTEVDGSMLSIAMNVTQLGSVDATRAGGILRFDSAGSFNLFGHAPGAGNSQYLNLSMSTGRAIFSDTSTTRAILSDTLWGGVFYSPNGATEVDIASNSYGIIVKARNSGFGDITPDFGVEIATTSTRGYFGVSSAPDADGDLLTVDAIGNVGIGTSTPSARLAVVGTVDITGTSTFAGWVGIGTTTPTSALTVSGSATITNTLQVGLTTSLLGTVTIGPFTAAGTDENAAQLASTGRITLNRSLNDTSKVLDVYANTNNTSYIQANGVAYFSNKLGIGTTTGSTSLAVNGGIMATDLLGGATNLTVDANGQIIRDPSDARLKENISDIENALELVLALRGVRYEWQDEERFGTQTEVGFIAQEVDLVVPEVVSKGGDYWSLNTKNLVAVVVEAIQDVWEVVSGHEERLDTLEAENAALRERLDALESSSGNSSPSTPTESTSGEPVTTSYEADTSTTVDEEETDANNTETVPDSVEEPVTEAPVEGSVSDSSNVTPAE